MDSETLIDMYNTALTITESVEHLKLDALEEGLKDTNVTFRLQQSLYNLYALQEELDRRIRFAKEDGR